jgi:hypothetical protein
MRHARTGAVGLAAAAALAVGVSPAGASAAMSAAQPTKLQRQVDQVDQRAGTADVRPKASMPLAGQAMCLTSF